MKLVVAAADGLASEGQRRGAAIGRVVGIERLGQRGQQELTSVSDIDPASIAAASSVKVLPVTVAVPPGPTPAQLADASRSPAGRYR